MQIVAFLYVYYLPDLYTYWRTKHLPDLAYEILTVNVVPHVYRLCNIARQ